MKSKDYVAGKTAGEALLKVAGPAAVVQALNHDEATVRMQAAVVLGHSGKYVKEAMPLLLRRLKDPEPKVRRFAAIAVARTVVAEKLDPKEAVAGLVELLTDGSDKETQFTAADALGMMGPLAKDAIPALLETVKNSSGAVRGRSLYTLGSAGADAKTM